MNETLYTGRESLWSISYPQPARLLPGTSTPQSNLFQSVRALM